MDTTPQAADAYDAYDAATDTTFPDVDGAAVPVEVVGPVATIERSAVSVTTEQLPVSVGSTTRLFGAVPDRESVCIKAAGGSVWVGNQTVTPGTGFLLNDGESLVLTARCALYAVALAAGATVYVIGQHRDGSVK